MCFIFQVSHVSIFFGPSLFSPRNRIPTSSSSMLPRASSPGRSESLPSGKHTKNYRKSPFFRGRSTIQMAIFNSKLFVYQRSPLDTLEPEKRCLGIRSLCHSNLSGSAPRGSSLARQNVRSTFRATSNLRAVSKRFQLFFWTSQRSCTCSLWSVDQSVFMLINGVIDGYRCIYPNHYQSDNYYSLNATIDDLETNHRNKGQDGSWRDPLIPRLAVSTVYSILSSQL